MIENTLSTAKGLLNRQEESVKALMEALTVVGIMMSFAGSSRPASGSEHHISHFFEIVGIVNSEEYLPHGIDVAYSTFITSEIREKILRTQFPDAIFRLDRDEYTEKINEIYKSVANGCIELQDKVGNYTADRLSVYKQKENEIRKVLEEAPKAEEIEKMLEVAEIYMEDFYSLYRSEKISNAISYVKDLKDRYTVLWLYYDLMGEEQIV